MATFASHDERLDGLLDVVDGSAFVAPQQVLRLVVQGGNENDGNDPGAGADGCACLYTRSDVLTPGGSKYIDPARGGGGGREPRFLSGAVEGQIERIVPRIGTLYFGPASLSCAST